ISLNDCLACSGCITSAESILVASQSHQDVYAALASNASSPPDQRKTIVITLSPQSRASFAAKYNLSPLSVHQRLYGFFTKLGCDHVVDASFARDFSLIESAREFVRRYRSVNGNGISGEGIMPMLASACPGWICYAEKTHDYILPNISTTKSPQQIMGSLLKTHFAEKMGLASPASVYHVSVMPCYDKKLEASRADFYNDVYRTRDVDTVITTGEVERMLKEKGVSIHDLPEVPIPDLFTRIITDPNTQQQQLTGTEGSSSGGYLSYIFRYAVRELYAWSVVVKPGRNLDFSEVIFNVGNVETLKFAKAYGFRNIQNLVRKAKPEDASGGSHHFVEVMACPSGCVNGGGQLKPDIFDAQGNVIEGPASKEYVQGAESIYQSVGKVLYMEPEVNASVVHLYRTGWEVWTANGRGICCIRSIMKLQVDASNGLNVKW
ncbi:iron hydrogenase, partial [Rhizoclosmatium globosum]